MNNIWDGLWYTNEGYFVLVKDCMANWVNINGEVSNVLVEKVSLNGDTQVYGKLMTRRRGEEKFVEGSLDMAWPLIKKVKE